MAYQNDIPQANDKIKDSQSDMLENFAQIKTVFDIDHETFQAANGQGKHKTVTFPIHAPGAIGATEMRIHANNSAVTGNVELFVENGSLGTNFEFTSAKKASAGWTTTPAGVLIKWGNATIAGSATGLSTFPWPAAASDIAFVTQYWAIVVVGADPANINKDVNAVAYVTSVANPLNVQYQIWRRNLFNTKGTNQNPFSVWVLGIGTQ